MESSESSDQIRENISFKTIKTNTEKIKKFQ